jgi:DNA-binding GntR family transcriptional regulator
VSTREFVAEYIRERIFRGDYPPHSRIPQDEVAAAVGMSRIPVREALVTLEAEGYVAMPTNQGAFVNPLSEFDIRSQFELRGFTRGLAARRAAGIGSPSTAAALRRTYTELARTEDADVFRRLTAEFLGYILESGGSPRLNAALARLRNIVPGNFYTVVPGSMAVGRKACKRELDAQLKKDPDAAMRASVAGSLAHSEVLIAMLRERGQLIEDEVGLPPVFPSQR